MEKLFEMEFTLGKYSVNIVEIIWDLEHCINLLDKAKTELRGWISILMKVLLWAKCYQTVSHTTEKSFLTGRLSRCSKLHLSLKENTSITIT